MRSPAGMTVTPGAREQSGSGNNGSVETVSRGGVMPGRLIGGGLLRVGSLRGSFVGFTGADGLGLVRLEPSLAGGGRQKHDEKKDDEVEAHPADGLAGGDFTDGEADGDDDGEDSATGVRGPPPSGAGEWGGLLNLDRLPVGNSHAGDGFAVVVVPVAVAADDAGEEDDRGAEPDDPFKKPAGAGEDEELLFLLQFVDGGGHDHFIEEGSADQDGGADDVQISCEEVDEDMEKVGIHCISETAGGAG